MTTRIRPSSRFRPLVAAGASLTLVAAGLYAVAQPAAAAESAVFINPGTNSWTVPTGVTVIKVEAYGAGGGGSSYGYPSSSVERSARGGHGAVVTAYRTVTPGSTLTINVGGGGIGLFQPSTTSGYSSGGGGGAATTVYEGSIASDSQRIVAGGGGGASTNYMSAGGTQAWQGGDGSADGTYTGGNGAGAQGGEGGNADGNGTGGTAATGGSPAVGGAGGSGSANGDDASGCDNPLSSGDVGAGGGGGGGLGGDGGSDCYIPADEGGTSANTAGGNYYIGGGGSGAGGGGGGWNGAGGGGYGGGGGSGGIYTQYSPLGGGGAGGSTAPTPPAGFPAPDYTPGGNGGSAGVSGGVGFANSGGSGAVVIQWDLGLSQTITFPQLPDAPITESGQALTATASSGLAVSYSSITPDMCTVTGAAITYVTAGTCVIVASQPGNDIYGPAASVTRAFEITEVKQSQTPAPGSVKVPSSIPASGSTLVASLNPHTTAGTPIKVRAKCTLMKRSKAASRGDLRLCSLARVTKGKKRGTYLKTYGKRIKVTLTWSAAGSSTLDPYKLVKTYRT